MAFEDINSYVMAPGGNFGKRYYTASMILSTTEGVYDADFIYATPRYIGCTETVDELGVFCTVANGTKKFRLGVYDAIWIGDTTNGGYPGALVVDSGEGTLDAIGNRNNILTLSSPVVLGPAKEYWFVAFFKENAGVTTTNLCLDYMSWNGNPVGGNPFQGGFKVAHVYGALPATFPNGGESMASPVNVVRGVSAVTPI